MTRRWPRYAAISMLLACAAVLGACADREEEARGGAARAQAPSPPTRGARTEPPPAPPSALAVSVDPATGQLGATLALPSLPTRAGLEPQLALVYTGSAVDLGSGLGSGFALSVPSITVSDEYGLTLPPASEDDPLITPMQYQGSRLVFVAKRAGGGAEYRPEVSEQATRVYYHPAPTQLTATDGRALSFQGFLVVHADGSREVYSGDPAEAELDVFSDESGRPLPVPTRLPLRYRLAPSGDYVAYEYERKQDDQRSYLKAVVFAGGSARYDLTLSKLAGAADRPVFSQGFEQRQTYVYTRIVASFEGNPVQRWFPVYQGSDGEAARLIVAEEARAIAAAAFAPSAVSSSEASLLVGVLRFAGGSEPVTAQTLHLPPLAFSYTEQTRADLARRTTVQTIPLASVTGFGPQQGAAYLDVDHDGLIDVATSAGAPAITTLYRNTGTLGDDAFVREPTPLTVARADASAPVAPNFRGGTRAAWLPGDFDGDGIADLLEVEPAPGASGSLLTLYPGQAGTSQHARALRSYPSDRDVSTFVDGRAQAVDLNADGRDDLLVAVQQGSAWSFDVLLNVTKSFGKPGADALAFMDIADVLEAPAMFNAPARRGVDFRLSAAANRLVDVNGDGLADLTVVHTTGAGERGLCVFENRGALRTQVDVEGSAFLKDARLFGDASSDATCPGGYFVVVPGLDAATSINALWLIDVTGDGLTDLVNVGPGGASVQVWAGRGRSGFRAFGSIALPLDAPLRVDPSNRWNTRVLDFDGDGMEEIVVYESDPAQGGARLHVLDFNRLDGKNLAPQRLLTEAREGQGLRHLIQYTNSTDELLRDRAHARSDARGVPTVAPVVKRLFTQLADAPPRILAYRYHALTADLVGRGNLGFGEVDVLDYGDAHAEHALWRLRFDVAGDRFRARVFASREVGRTLFGLSGASVDAALAVLDAAPKNGPPSAAFVSQTRETRAERALPEGVRHVHVATDWETDLPTSAARPALYLRPKRAQTTRHGTGATVATTTRTYARHDACNRVEAESLVESAVAGPGGTQVPERAQQTVTTYQNACASVLAASQVLPLTSAARIVTTAQRGRALLQTDFAYADTPLAPSSIRTTAHLDRAGLPTQLAAAIADVPPNTVHYTYDAYLNVLTTRDDEGPRAATIYDAQGIRVAEAQNALGHAQRYEFTPGWIAPTRVITPRGDVIQQVYDALQRLTEVTRSDGSTTSYAYREAEGVATRRVLITASRGSETHQTLHVHRADGLRVARIEPGEDGRSRTVDAVGYGRRGDPVVEANPFLRSESVRRLLDAEGDGWAPAAARCGGGEVACSAYDAFGRPVAFVAASRGYSERTRHEAWGAHLEVRDDGETRTRQTVQRDDTIFAVVDEDQHVHTFAHDDADNLTAVQLAGEEQARGARADSLGRVVYAAVPFGMTKVFRHDARGRVVREEIFDASLHSGGHVETRYDALDRPRERKSFAPGADAPSLVHTWTYDAQRDGTRADVGTMVRAVAEDALAEATFEESFAHDLDGRITARHARFTSEAATRSYDEAWAYDLGGDARSYTDPFGNQLSYERTPSGQLSATRWQRGGSALVLARASAFDAFGQATQRERPAHGLQDVRGFDAATGLLTSHRACSGGQQPCLQDDTWKRRGDGRVTGRTGIDFQAGYGYTPRGELKRATVGAASYGYAFDPAGHLEKLGERARADFAREQSPIALPDGYDHDAFGRITRGGVIRDVGYDVEGRARVVTLADRRIIYTYSALGERVARQVEGTSELTVYPTPRARDDGSERQSLVLHDGEPLALLVDGDRSYGLLTDHLGVVEAMVGSDGARAASWRFSPFGALAEGAPASVAGLASLELVRSFTGTLRDEHTGLVHMGAREYLPGAGSFTTPDPLFLDEPSLCPTSPLECALYAYVAHDPLNYVDPSGTTAQARGTQRYLNKSTKAGKPYAKPGPKTDVNAPHNRKINDVIAAETAKGMIHLGGGAGPGGKTEITIPTPGGSKDTRRADATFRNPTTGAIEHHNVGLKNRGNGTPIARERRALEDVRSKAPKADRNITFHDYGST